MRETREREAARRERRCVVGERAREERGCCGEEGFAANAKKRGAAHAEGIAQFGGRFKSARA
jgi:hypothetical protein